MAAINSTQLSKIVYNGQKMFITEHCIQTWYKRWRYPSWAIILITTYMKIWYHEAIILLIKSSCLQQYIAKTFHVYKNILSNKAKLHLK